MLAEIFMVRLEAAARALKETALSRNSSFVPFTPNAQVAFKQSRDRLAETVREAESANR
jgi:hypothetical protein